MDDSQYELQHSIDKVKVSSGNNDNIEDDNAAINIKNLSIDTNHKISTPDPHLDSVPIVQPIDDLEQIKEQIIIHDNDDDNYELERNIEDIDGEDQDLDDDGFEEDIEIFSTKIQDLGIPITKKISKNDANSFVGGDDDKLITSKKTFSFQLPFGNLNFKLSFPSVNLPTVNIPSVNLPVKFWKDDEPDPIVEDIRLKLQRQESIGTIDDANFFKTYKGRDDVRLRAVKHSLTNKYTEFKNNNKNMNALNSLNSSLNSSSNSSNNPSTPNLSSTSTLTGPDYETIYSKISGNIVILGGYRGSVLRDTKTNKRVWIPIKAGFHLRKINLLLGPDREDELNAHKTIYPDGVLKNIGPIDFCKLFIKKLKNNNKTNVYEFGYDWRLSGKFVGEQLIKYLQEIKAKTGKPTLVIAHSMGGLIAHYAVQKTPELFRSVIYVGVPSECLNILGPIRKGDAVLFSDKILTPESNFMMRSSFNFLPLSGMVFYNRDTHEPIILDLFNPDTWVEYNLNPLVGKDRLLKKPQNSYFARFKSMIDSFPIKSSSPTSNSFNLLSPSRSPRNDLTSSSPNTKSSKSPSSKSPKDTSPNSKIIPSRGDSVSPIHHDLTNTNIIDDDFAISFETAYNYLATTLADTKDFILGLNYKPELESKYPPMAIVYGNTVPSVRGSNVSGPQDIVDGNYWDFFYGHGDGVVHQKWLMPERKGFKIYDDNTGTGQIVGKFSTNAGHVNLMTDFKAMGEALNAVYEAEKIWNYQEN